MFDNQLVGGIKGMRKLSKDHLAALEFCKHPRRFNDILYGDLSEKQGIGWPRLHKLIRDLKSMGYLARNRFSKYYTIVETSQFYKNEEVS
jgi:hypothetical protein